MPIKMTIQKNGYQLEAVYKTARGSRRVGVVRVEDSTPLDDQDTFRRAMGELLGLVGENPEGRLPSRSLTVRKEVS